MSQEIQIDYSLPVPVFPLPGCVLLPHVTIPLHIFEQRYRAMLRDTLDVKHQLIAMALFEGDDWRDQYEGKPAIRPIVGVGTVHAYEELPDGRFNLSLRGLSRAKVVREIDHDPYRMIHVEPIEDADIMEIDLTEERDALRSLLTDKYLQQWAPVSALSQWLRCESSTLALIDLTAMHICDVEQRYVMLAEADPFVRAKKLIAILREARKALETAANMEPPEQSDRINLN